MHFTFAIWLHAVIFYLNLTNLGMPMLALVGISFDAYRKLNGVAIEIRSQSVNWQCQLLGLQGNSKLKSGA